MEAKKVNVFAFFMIIIMCAFSIYIGIFGKGQGNDGMSAYEIACKNGFTGTEVEYLQSLYGKDGSDVTIEDVYQSYLKVNDLTQEEYSFATFILNHYPNAILDADETKTLVELSTSEALRSTVDICYSYYMDSRIIYVYKEQDGSGNSKYRINTASSFKDTAIGISAGSGVIYSLDEECAYIVTNYHVVYCGNYSNDDNYYVYGIIGDNGSADTYFTATYSEDMVVQEQVVMLVGGLFPQTVNASYIYETNEDFEYAPIYTHFADEYKLYLNGYQDTDYAVTASFVGGSADNDIAVLKVEKNKQTPQCPLFNGSYKGVTLADSSNISRGETAIAIGNPLIPDTSKVNTNDVYTAEEYVSRYESSYIDALCLTSTEGVVSNVSENCAFQSIINPNDVMNLRLIRVSSAINAGNSGGGLYDIYGRLIGIVNGKVESSSYDNVGYAIPVNVASGIVEQIIEQCDGDFTKTQIAIVSREILGIGLKDSRSGGKSPYYDLTTLNWVYEKTVKVTSLTTDFALASGLEIGDEILSISINGMEAKELNNHYDFDDIMLRVMVPETRVVVRFNISRESSEVEYIDITLTKEDFKFIN